MGTAPSTPQLAHNVKRLAQLELAGAGQVYIDGHYAYLGHLTNTERLGTTILDVSDPRKPRIVSQIFLDDAGSHSHKARVVGDIMIVNSEKNASELGRKAEQLPSARAALRQTLGRDPTRAELAARLSVSDSDVPLLEAAEREPYDKGGFRVYDVSDKAKPKLIAFQKTGGIGVHRFDMDANYAYISTEMPGYIGNILVIYDIRNPARPEEVSRWWMPGQHVAVGEQPTWPGRRNRLHHALRSGDFLWAGCWMAGAHVIDVSDIRGPRTAGEYNYHPPFPEPTHTFKEMPVGIAGKRIAVAIDEEDHAHGAQEMARRRGRPHARLWVFDVTDMSNIQPVSTFEVSELDSPWSRAAPGRFGAHQFWERMNGTLVYCTWFAGGLRIVDIADPFAPQEVGYFIPEPARGRPGPLTNDVDVDARGVIYVVDRGPRFDILEFNRPG
ncbi:MAG: RNA polymerase subunit sigma-70 [Betaproteobacteria bacterium]|nr:RNA polymerase subunit sigma-70 [Betaproteobacteria bacterium]